MLRNSFTFFTISHKDLQIDKIFHPTISISRSIFMDKAFLFVKDPGNASPLPAMGPHSKPELRPWELVHIP
jgi:hypothetical protein